MNKNFADLLELETDLLEIETALPKSRPSCWKSRLCHSMNLDSDSAFSICDRQSRFQAVGLDFQQVGVDYRKGGLNFQRVGKMLV